MSPIRARKTFRFGPVRVNFTGRGFSSWGLRLGPWSWNARTRTHRVDLPGPWHWTNTPARKNRDTR
ncbi:MAG: DUF4236 domain-containing protein [Dermatophilaceae bacterium]